MQVFVKREQTEKTWCQDKQIRKQTPISYTFLHRLGSFNESLDAVTAAVDCDSGFGTTVENVIEPCSLPARLTGDTQLATEIRITGRSDHSGLKFLKTQI